MQKYKHLYEANVGTSHYLLSKVYRAKECIDQEDPPKPDPKQINEEARGQDAGSTDAPKQ